MAEIHAFVPVVDLEKSKRGKIYASLENFRRLIKSRLIKIQYNEIRKEVEVYIPNKNWLPDNALNCAISELTSLCEENGMGSGHVLKYMLSTADENKINPIAEWIESKSWDGISRLDKFYSTLSSSNEDLKAILMQRWMVSAIAALYEPKGISAAGMLVLSGATNLGKTNWFKNLLPQEMREWIKDGVILVASDRDSAKCCLENWLVELGELEATFKKSDLAALKAFITADRDVMRLSYAAANSRFPRRTVLFGSVDKKSYLRDPAGNRRFWTVECLSIDHTHGLDMQQIWSEFKVLYDNGESWYLKHDEYLMLMEANKEYEIISPMKEDLLKKYDWHGSLIDWKTATEILRDMDYRNITDGQATQCGLFVRELNKNQFRRSNGRNLLGIPRTNI